MTEGNHAIGESEVLMTLADIETNRPAIINNLKAQGLRVYPMLRNGVTIGDAAMCRRCGYSIVVDWSDPGFGKGTHACRPDRITELIPEKTDTGTGFVYLIRCRELTKIGQSANPSHRIATIDSGVPFELEVIGVIESDDYVNLEIRLHGVFASKRRKGEWFLLEESDIAWIRSKYEVKPLEAE